MEKLKKLFLGLIFVSLMIPVTACNPYENFENEEQLDPVKDTGIRDSEHELHERDEALNDLERERGAYEHQGDYDRRQD